MSWKRGRTGRTLATLGAAVAVVPAAGCVTVAVAAPRNESGATMPVPVQGFLLATKAQRQVARADRGCSAKVAHPKPRVGRFGVGAPSAALTDALGVLRRPQTAAEQAAPLSPAASGRAGDITFFRSATRTVHGPGRLSVTIQVGSGRLSVPEILEPACERRVVVALRDLAKTQPPAVRRAATDALRLEKSRAVSGVHDWIALGGPLGSGPFIWDAKAFDDYGLISTLQGNPVSQAVGVVPDGVASVTLHLAGHAPPSLSALLIEPSGTKPKPGRGGTIRASVSDNVWFMPRLPEPILSAAVRRMTWRDANGRVVHVVQIAGS